MTCFWLALQHWSVAPGFCAGQSRGPQSGSEHRRNLESDLQSMHAELDELSVLWDAARRPQRRGGRSSQASACDCCGHMYWLVSGDACQPWISSPVVMSQVIQNNEMLSSIPCHSERLHIMHVF